MKDVCGNCHQLRFVNSFFVQYEALLDLYDSKYAKPGLELYEAAIGVLRTDPQYAKFSHPVDWAWFEIWHHEGRRARHAAAMQAPDYTHWHGTYDLAKHWMTKFVPEIKHVIHEYRERAPEEVETLQKKLDEITNSDDWKWSVNREDPSVKKLREKRQREFKARYK